MRCVRLQRASAVRPFGFLLLLCSILAAPAFSTSVIPVTDRDLYARADAIVHGVVDSTRVEESPTGQPETVTVIKPIDVLKGGVFGTDFVIRQAGGTLPDGRFLKIWGRPEYRPGSEVVVFALARPEGDFQTAELLLGKFEVLTDDAGNRFAVPELTRRVPAGVTVHRNAQPIPYRIEDGPEPATAEPDSSTGARPLQAFLTYLMNGAKGAAPTAKPVGELHPMDGGKPSIEPDWGNINDSLWRWNNGASAVWTLVGSANISGGGGAEAQGSVATWDNEPNSSINYSIGGGSPNTIDLNAASSSGCGWNSCFTGSGVIGCGGPSGGGSNSWRGENYTTITGGFVQVRCYASYNGVSSTITQSVITHELGHTLGLGHSDQNVSAHDVCRGDESAATMRSSVQNRTTLGTDDADAVRWLYGDGGNSCTASSCTPPAITANPASVTIASGQSTTVTVSASGSSPLSYQWYNGASGNTGLPISGATGASLTIAPAATTTVWARVSNACGAANSASATITVTTSTPSSGRAPFDYDGDGRSDFSVIRPTEWNWYLLTQAGAVTITQWGLSNDKPVARDFDGDGRTDIAVWRNANGVWYVHRSSGGTTQQQWGLPGDVPVPADFDGDGRADMAVWRPTSGIWYVLLSSGGSQQQQWGLPGDIPVPGDYDGDGRADYAVWRPSNGTWYIYLPTGVRIVQWGLANDKPLAGDFDGDGATDLSVWRPANGVWYVMRSSGGAFQQQWGLTNDIPVAADFDGDGRTDFTVWRPSNGVWYVRQSSGLAIQQQWGLTNDFPAM